MYLYLYKDVDSRYRFKCCVLVFFLLLDLGLQENLNANPPPGFFSEWLRRLVSKPSGNSSSAPAPAIPTSLTFTGQPETNGSHDSHVIPNKRRKRSRLNEPPQHIAVNLSFALFLHVARLLYALYSILYILFLPPFHFPFPPPSVVHTATTYNV